MRLFIGRHAEAAQHSDDKHRPLSEVGREQAKRLAQFMAEVPLDYVVSSDAVRTTETAEFVCRGQVRAPDIQQDTSLYQADLADWLDVIRAIPEGVTAAYIVGHQPTVSQVVAYLCGSSKAVAPFPPATVACFESLESSVEFGQFPQPSIQYFA